MDEQNVRQELEARLLRVLRIALLRQVLQTAFRAVAEAFRVAAEYLSGIAKGLQLIAESGIIASGTLDKYEREVLCHPY